MSAASTLPIAMAGPYANRRAAGADADLLLRVRRCRDQLACPGNRRGQPPPCARDHDRQDAAGDRGEEKRADDESPGPTTAPTAAISFTSPAPVAPSTWPGIISARPSAKPATRAPERQPAHAGRRECRRRRRPSPRSARSESAACGCR